MQGLRLRSLLPVSGRAPGDGRVGRPAPRVGLVRDRLAERRPHVGSMVGPADRGGDPGPRRTRPPRRRGVLGRVHGRSPGDPLRPGYRGEGGGRGRRDRVHQDRDAERGSRVHAGPRRDRAGAPRRGGRGMSGRVVVVGGGVAGLATAYRLVSASTDMDVMLLEAGPEPGGKVRSVRVGDLLLDGGPDSLIARKPWAVQLARELGLARELVAPATGVTFVWTDHGLRRFPAGPFGIPIDLRELWGWDGMSRRGRIEALGDLVRKPRTEEGDEPLGGLLRRRIGGEATDSLVAPLLGGLFAGDVERLSSLATFPELVEWERRQGSLIRGARAAARTAADAVPPPMFLRPRGGMRRLTDALAAALGDRVRCDARVVSVDREGRGYVVRAGESEFSADAVVLATPA